MSTPPCCLTNEIPLKLVLMFKRVLIANRGEIAVRIIYALKELGIESVAVYSEADSESLHVALADYAVCIGPPDPKKSYLNIPQILSAAHVMGAEAIHPGYGFLAENPIFAEVVHENGLTFIGPSPKTMRLAGDKQLTKKVLEEAGLPVIPGTGETIKTVKDAHNAVEEIGGYPVLIKAKAGGGGRGMRIINSDDDLDRFFPVAQREAETAFGDPGLYVEKYIDRPKHIEVQVVADKYGNVVALGERECSIQRRYQKLLEESPVLSADKREKLLDYAITAAKYLQYHSVGTFEFLMDRDGNFYFMELNTRLQVEHPVTEMVTGIDLVKTQILIAAGEKLEINQADVNIHGHAIEVRINAEDVTRDFTPTPGTITRLHFPGGPGVRIDSHIYQGYTVPPYYDSLLAKLIVHDVDRDSAISRLKRALEETYIEGVSTTVPFFIKLIETPEFLSGTYDVRFVEREIL